MQVTLCLARRIYFLRFFIARGGHVTKFAPGPEVGWELSKQNLLKRRKLWQVTFFPPLNPSSYLLPEKQTWCLEHYQPFCDCRAERQKLGSLMTFGVAILVLDPLPWDFIYKREENTSMFWSLSYFQPLLLMAYFSQEPSIIIKKPMTVRRAEIEVRESKVRESRNG